MAKKEVWRHIKEYQGLYMVSSRSRVKRLARLVNSGNGAKRLLPELIMKPFWNQKDQLCIFLQKDGKAKIKLVYRLMATAFKKNPLKKLTVNHKDGRRRNNSLSNLEWATWSENNKHAFKTRLNNPAKNLPNNKREVQMLDLNNRPLRTFKSITEAANSIKGVVQSIHNVCSGKKHCKTAYGYKWKFI